MGCFTLVVSLAISAGLCIIVGGLGISSKPREQWGDESAEKGARVILLFWAYLIALVTASINACDYPRLRMYMPGCYAAGIVAGSAAIAYWTLVPVDHFIILSRSIFSIMIAIYSGILFEIQTGTILHWTFVLHDTKG